MVMGKIVEERKTERERKMERVVREEQERDGETRKE